MGNQITPYQSFSALLRSEPVQTRFNDILGKRAAAFMASMLSVYAGTRALQDCEPGSILTAAAKAAVLNLPIEPSLGFAYIIPFKKRATFVLGYKGMIQLAIRTGAYKTINATEIYEGERVIVNRLTGMVDLTGERISDNVVGYVSYFALKSGYEKYLAMDAATMERHAERYSKSWGDDKSAWTTNFDDMAKKTVLRLLLGKYGLMSIEMVDDETPAGIPSGELYVGVGNLPNPELGTGEPETEQSNPEGEPTPVGEPAPQMPPEPLPNPEA